MIYLFFMSQVWTMKLTELFVIICKPNICHFSDRFAGTIKVNIKEILMRNDSFLQTLIW